MKTKAELLAVAAEYNETAELPIDLWPDDIVERDGRITIFGVDAEEWLNVAMNPHTFPRYYTNIKNLATSIGSLCGQMSFTKAFLNPAAALAYARRITEPGIPGRITITYRASADAEAVALWKRHGARMNRVRANPLPADAAAALKGAA